MFRKFQLNLKDWSKNFNNGIDIEISVLENLMEVEDMSNHVSSQVLKTGGKLKELYMKKVAYMR